VVHDLQIVEAIHSAERCIPPTTIRSWIGQFNVHANALLLQGIGQLGIELQHSAAIELPHPACVCPAAALAYRLVLSYAFPHGIPPDPGKRARSFFPELQLPLSRLSPPLGLFRVL